MSGVLNEQRNPYKGSPARPWIRVRWLDPAGAEHAWNLLADTGNPCAAILSVRNMGLLKLRDAPDVRSNFGVLQAGWIHLHLPEFGISQEVIGYANDAAVAAAKASSPDFEGLVGLPLLRLLVYGGNATEFWIEIAPGRIASTAS